MLAADFSSADSSGLAWEAFLRVAPPRALDFTGNVGIRAWSLGLGCSSNLQGKTRSDQATLQHHGFNPNLTGRSATPLDAHLTCSGHVSPVNPAPSQAHAHACRHTNKTCYACIIYCIIQYIMLAGKHRQQVPLVQVP